MTPVSAVSRDDTQTGRKPLFGKSLRPVVANHGEPLRVGIVPPRGNEQTQDSQGKPQEAERCVQPLGDTSADCGLSDPDLAGWLEACPVALDDHAKAGILAMVRAAGAKPDCQGERHPG